MVTSHGKIIQYVIQCHLTRSRARARATYSFHCECANYLLLILRRHTRCTFFTCDITYQMLNFVRSLDPFRRVSALFIVSIFAGIRHFSHQPIMHGRMHCIHNNCQNMTKWKKPTLARTHARTAANTQGKKIESVHIDASATLSEHVEKIYKL